MLAIGNLTKFKSEIDKIRDQTSIDLEKIRESTKEVYERETRALKDAKNTAVTELEKSRLKYNESKQAYNELSQE